MTFATHFTLPMFEEILSLDAERPDEKDAAAMKAWREREQALEERTLVSAITSYLTELRDQGRLSVLANSYDYRTPFTGAWNRMVQRAWKTDDQEEWDWREITRFFGYAIDIQIIGFCLDRQRGRAKQSPAEFHEKLASEVTAGTWEPFRLPSENTCFVTGKRFLLRFTGWQGMLVTRGEDPFSRQFLQAPEFRRPLLPLHREVSFPSGNLLLADWFRINAFTEELDLPWEKKPDINASTGREDMIDHNLSFGVISIHVGNSSPQIFRKGDTLVFGQEDEFKETKFNVVGHVTTDLWNVTVVDEAILVDILAKTHGDEAQAVLDGYLKQVGKRSYVRLKVTPGTYHLYFRGDYWNFGARFNCPDLPLDGINYPKFVLSPTALSLQDPIGPIGPE